jgi:hypothetical protein
LQWDNFGKVNGPTFVATDTFANINPEWSDSIVQEEPIQGR